MYKTMIVVCQRIFNSRASLRPSGPLVLIVKTIHIILQTRGLDSRLPYTDDERVISAGALARLALYTAQS